MHRHQLHGRLAVIVPVLLPILVDVVTNPRPFGQRLLRFELLRLVVRFRVHRVALSAVVVQDIGLHQHLCKDARPEVVETMRKLNSVLILLRKDPVLQRHQHTL